MMSNETIHVGQKHSKPFIPDEMQSLRVEVEALRAIRIKTDDATAEVIRVLKLEHKNEVCELNVRIQMLEADLALQKQQNHAVDLEIAVSKNRGLRKQLAERDRVAQSVASTLRGVLNMHFDGTR